MHRGGHGLGKRKQTFLENELASQVTDGSFIKQEALLGSIRDVWPYCTTIANGNIRAQHRLWSCSIIDFWRSSDVQFVQSSPEYQP